MSTSQNAALRKLLAELNGNENNQAFENATPAADQIAHGNSEYRNGSNGQPVYANNFSLPGLGHLPPQTMLVPSNQSSVVSSTSNQSTLKLTPANPTLSLTRSRSSTPQPPIPDASTITTWPAALKHVTKYLCTDDKVSNRIKHLISQQRKHEQQWWDGREALIKQQQGRAGTSQQVAALLKSIGGKDMPMTEADPAANLAELATYDKKVYSGLVSMAVDFDRQLRAIGVPFYAIKHDLVILEDGKESQKSTKGRLDKGELRELQKRILQTLEDLFGDTD